MGTNPLLIVLVAMCEATGVGLLGSVLLRRFPLAQPLLGVVLISLFAMIASTGVVVALFGFSPVQAAVELSAACVAALVSLNIGLLRTGDQVATGNDPSGAAGRDRPARRDVVAQVSHDLRAPLARLRATVESARDDAPADQRTQLGQISTELDRLGSQLDGLFRLSGIQADGLLLRRYAVALDGLVQDIAAGCDARAGERGVAVRVNAEPVVVSADRSRLAEALTTLVTEAIDHSGRGGAVLITIGGDAVWAIVSVDAEHGRAAAESDAPGPRDGIDFALAEEIARAHNGELTSHRLPHGHRFHLRIPIS